MRCLMIGTTISAALAFAAPSWAQVAEAPIPPPILQPPPSFSQAAATPQQPAAAIDMPKASAAAPQPSTQPQSTAETAKPGPSRRTQRPPIRAPHRERSRFDYTAQQLNGRELGAVGLPSESGMPHDYMADQL